MPYVKLTQYPMLKASDIVREFPEANVVSGVLKSVDFDMISDLDTVKDKNPYLVMLVELADENYVGTARLESPNSNVLNAGLIMRSLSSLLQLKTNIGAPFAYLKGSKVTVVFRDEDTTKIVALGNAEGSRFIVLDDLYATGLWG